MSQCWYFDLMNSFTLNADDKYPQTPESLIESDQLELLSGLLRFKRKSVKGNRFQGALHRNAKCLLYLPPSPIYLYNRKPIIL